MLKFSNGKPVLLSFLTSNRQEKIEIFSKALLVWTVLLALVVPPLTSLVWHPTPETLQYLRTIDCMCVFGLIILLFLAFKLYLTLEERYQIDKIIIRQLENQYSFNVHALKDSTRCEVCHQSDCFNSTTNHCARCGELVSELVKPGKLI